MASDDSSTPDLATILATLAGLAPPNQQSRQAEAIQPIQSSLYSQQVPQTQQFHPLPYAQHPPQQWQNLPPNYPVPQSSKSFDAPKTHLIDPATIIDWSSGLKCVMRTVAKQESILHDIRRMIKSQHEHEQQWWNGRQDLIERQKARKEGQRKLDDVLKLVGGVVATGVSNTSPEELAIELQTFDLKVYRAQIQMTKEFSAKFKSLGVPFFGTKGELVSVIKKDASGEKGSGNANAGKGMIAEIELIKLQKKMISLLEDLCGD